MKPLTAKQRQELEAKIYKASQPEAIYSNDYWYVSDGDGGYVCLPLNLQDVAYVLAKAYRDAEFDGEPMTGRDATHLYEFSQVPVMFAISDPTKDYSGQSEEFYRFLYNLLEDDLCEETYSSAKELHDAILADE